MNPATLADDPETVADDLEHRTASEALEWMFEQFGSDHLIACSFQKTSSVTLHLATRINPEARFFYLDTDVLFPETYETRDRLAEHFDISFERFQDLASPSRPVCTATSSGSATPTPAAGCARSSRCAGPGFRRLLGLRHPP